MHSDLHALPVVVHHPTTCPQTTSATHVTDVVGGITTAAAVARIGAHALAVLLIAQIHSTEQDVAALALDGALTAASVGLARNLAVAQGVAYPM